MASTRSTPGVNVDNIFQPMNAPTNLSVTEDGDQQTSDADGDKNGKPGADAEQYKNLAQFTEKNLIQYRCDDQQSDEPMDGEPTAAFDRTLEDQDSDTEQTTEESKIIDVQNSGYFSKDYRVLENATYGTQDQGAKILKQLQEQYGDFDVENSRAYDSNPNPEKQNMMMSFAQQESNKGEDDKYEEDRDLDNLGLEDAGFDTDFHGVNRGSFESVENMPDNMMIGLRGMGDSIDHSSFEN